MLATFLHLISSDEIGQSDRTEQYSSQTEILK